MIKKLLMIGLGSTMIGIGINTFIIPSHIINGGIFGISLLVKYLWGFKMGMTMVCLNVPIYLMALKYDLSYFLHSLYGLMITSIMIDILFPLNGIVRFPVIASALLGGLTIGMGVGIMLRYNASPGGIDLLVFLISKSTSINVGYLLILIDSLIILFGLWILGDKILLYSLITVASVAAMAGILTSFKSVTYIR
ncbi:YitT family protein [Bacillus smithii]|uniref:YitT family protein n=1 Tax=Bacillus smithii TaxID=1479 RepID=UPI002E1BA30E|nr:YitT family protein [Bacillus smithii]